MSAPDQRIRQVAIVLQSMDADTSRSLLAQLPKEMAKAVRQAMVNLGAVTPKERAQAMSGLQGLMGSLNRSPSNPSAFEETEASPAAALVANSMPSDQIDLSSASTSQSKPKQSNSASWSSQSEYSTETPWLAWEPASLATFLSDERPTVIATVLNQLSPERAKALLDHLPLSTASATLAAIPDLFLTDPQILTDILAEIDRKLPKTAPIQKAATIAGISKLSAIIDQFGESQRQAWLDSIASQNESVAKQLGWSAPIASSIVSQVAASTNFRTSPTTTPMEAITIQTSASANHITASPSVTDDIFDESMIVPIERYRESVDTSRSFERGQETESDTTASISGSKSTRIASAGQDSRSNEFDALLELSDTDLVTLLHACDKATVLAALRGASKRVIQRIERLIPRNEVQRFRNHVKHRTADSAQEAELAQANILLRAEELQVASRIASLSTVTFVAA